MSNEIEREPGPRRFRAGEKPPNYDQKLPGEVLTADEVSAILAQCSHRAPTGLRDRALITVMYRASLRVNEALDLIASDIDMKGGTVRVRHGKGDKARTVAVGDGVLAVLQLWLDARRALGLARNGTRLFCTLKGTPVSDTAVRLMLKRRAAAAGIERRVHPHALRHSRAFEMANSGVPTHLIQAQLGHAHLSTTDTYLKHIAPAAVIELGRSDDWTDPAPAPRKRRSPDKPAASDRPLPVSLPAPEPPRPVIERTAAPAPPAIFTEPDPHEHDWTESGDCKTCPANYYDSQGG